MEVNPKQAEESLRSIEQARLVASRHSHNNGIVPLVWGFFVLIGLPLYDLLPSLVATIVFCAGAILCSLWTILYGRRLPVQPFKFEKPLLFLWWGLYYAVVLIGGIYGIQWLFHGRPPFMFTIIGIVAAAPLLYVGARMWQRAHTREI